MKLRTKRRILIAVLWLSFVWPLAHFVLVKKYDLSPWSWWGWAMYTQPPPRISAMALSVDTRRPLFLNELPKDKERAVRAVYEVFSLDRMAYGQLREPDDFARAVLEAFPEPSGVRIELQRIVMDPSTGMLVPSDEWSYMYAREDLIP